MARTAHRLHVPRRLAAALALTGAMAVAGQAMAIPVDDDDPPPPANSRPSAALTATPNPVVVPPQLVAAPISANALPRDTVTDTVIRFGTTVKFSAAGSGDADGEIVKYEWDLDGRPGFEKTTTTPRRRRPAPGRPPRHRHARREVHRHLPVRIHRAPTALVVTQPRRPRS